MKVAVCVKCKEILVAGSFNDKIPPSHVAPDGKSHAAKIVKIDKDPMGPTESAADYFKRLKKTYKAELFS